MAYLVSIRLKYEIRSRNIFKLAGPGVTLSSRLQKLTRALSTSTSGFWPGRHRTLGQSSHILWSKVSSPRSSWERATEAQCSSALTWLCHNKSIHTKSKEATSAVKSVLDGAFAAPMIPYQPASSTTRVAAAAHYQVGTGTVAVERAAGPPSEATSDKDVNDLLTLSSFFAPATKIPLDMLHRGATPRKRWNKEGGIESRASNVDPGLASLLADRNRVICVLEKLRQSGDAATYPAHESYTINDEARRRTLDSLDGEQQKSWKEQALLVAYHALSWKNIEAP